MSNDLTAEEIREKILENNRTLDVDRGLSDTDAERAMVDYADVMMKGFFLWLDTLPEPMKIDEADFEPHEVARTYVEMFKNDKTIFRGNWL